MIARGGNSKFVSGRRRSSTALTATAFLPTNRLHRDTIETMAIISASANLLSANHSKIIQMHAAKTSAFVSAHTCRLLLVLLFLFMYGPRTMIDHRSVCEGTLYGSCCTSIVRSCR